MGRFWAVQGKTIRAVSGGLSAKGLSYR
jgi:hypothetical protein